LQIPRFQIPDSGFRIPDSRFQIHMSRLSVNVNKVATLRNARGGSVPSVIRAVEICLSAGAPGITVHPRADERHIRRSDVREIAAVIARRRGGSDRIEFNIEGDPRPDLVELVLAVRPDQCTLVPVVPGEITSQAGWPADTSVEALGRDVARLRAAGVRVGLFVDPEEAPIRWAARVGADRVELYTEPFARAFERGDGEASFARYATAATLAHSLGLGVNAGHDLDLENLRLFRTLPHLDEVSIGHALISHALWVGLERSVKDYLAALGT
jgi:pyridoxine 5-phosphate synthase